MGYRSTNIGNYRLQNPEKYVGDKTDITFRSSWELHMNKFLDTNPSVIQWSSEPFPIPYYHPIKQKICNYYVDYWIKYRDRDGKIHQELIEVKPDSQTKMPKKPKSKKVSPKTRARLISEQATYAVNVSKWQAATEFAKKQGIQFRIVTENQLFR